MIKIGLIGTSIITEKFIDAASQLTNCKVEIVYSRSESRALEFANKFNIPKTTTSFEELANNCDMVYIASPNSLHFDQTIKMLNLKKHVLCEKPMSLTSTEIEKMFFCSRRNNVCLMEAMKNTFTPNFKSLKKNLYKIGKIRGFIGNFSQYSSRYDDLKDGILTNIFDPNFGGGADFDIGVYPLYFTLALFGSPKAYSKHDLALSSKVSGIGNISLVYDEMIATIFYSKITNSFIPNEIQGELGTIVIDSISNIKNIKIFYNNGVIEDISVSQLENSMVYELEEFIDLIKNNKIESEVNTCSLSSKVISIINE